MHTLGMDDMKSFGDSTDARSTCQAACRNDGVRLASSAARLAIVGRGCAALGARPRHGSRPMPRSPTPRCAATRAPFALLLKQGADVNAAQGDGMTALHWAATHGDVDQTRMLHLRRRATSRRRRATATTRRCISRRRPGRRPSSRRCSRRAPNVNAATTSGGATPLHLAAANGNADAVDALLDKGAEVDARETAWSRRRSCGRRRTIA